MHLYKKKNIIYLFILIINTISAQENTVGLIINDEQSFNGYTLFAPNLSTTTYLIDNEGRLVNQWESEYVPGLSAYLLEEGHLLRSAKVEDPDTSATRDTRTGGFQKFDWDNNSIWEFYYGSQHHDIEPMPNGNVLMLVNDRKSKNDAIQAGRDPALIISNNIRSLSILEIMQTGPTIGDIVWQWNAWDHLIQESDTTKDNFGTVVTHPELIDINFANNGGQDWLHTNSIAYNEDLDQILVSNRSTSEIWIIDHSTATTEMAATHEGGNSGKGGDLLYRWGNPIAYGAGTADDQKLHGQHDANWVAAELRGEGNIMVFNNGIGRPVGPFSSVIEIVPPPINNLGNYMLDAGSAYGPLDYMWEYTAPMPEDFISPRYGGSQRLPNGNTLICNSDIGEFFELNQADEVVWKYINPVAGDGIIPQNSTEIDNNQVFRCYRYGTDYPGLAGKDLTPGDPIELYPAVAIDGENSNISKFNLSNNYPNPFNPTTNIEFSLIEKGQVTIVVYDVLGNKVKTLANKIMEPGLKTIIWDSLDDNGSSVSSGIYFYSLQAGYQNQTKKMILLR